MKITGTFKIMEQKQTDNGTYVTIGDMDTFEKYTLALPRGSKVPETPTIELKDTPVRISWGKYNVVMRFTN